jgi:hypothetical protein
MSALYLNLHVNEDGLIDNSSVELGLNAWMVLKAIHTLTASKAWARLP